MNVDELAPLVVEAVREHASDLGLSPATLRADYILNDGGFVAANYTVSDGARAVHVKVAADDEHADELRAWMAVGDLLATRYRAPGVLGWLDVGAAGALVLQHVPGSGIDHGDPASRDEIVPVIRALHADADLAALAGAPRTLRESFLGYFWRICDADLTELSAAGSMPPFVDAGTVTWMRDEVAALRARCESSAAFDGPAMSPIHGDLWPGNVLRADDGPSWIIDWDTVRLGDPAVDLGLFLFTPVDRGADRRRWIADDDPALHERMDLAHRATLLTGVVDPLADWADADTAPAHADAVRAGKEAHHRWALARYRDLYV